MTPGAGVCIAGLPTINARTIDPSQLRIRLVSQLTSYAMVRPIARDAPGLEDLWQLHRSEAGAAHNSPDQFLANVDETDHGYSLKMSVKGMAALR